MKSPVAFFLANRHEPTVGTELRLGALAVEAEAGVLAAGLHLLFVRSKALEVTLSSCAPPVCHSRDHSRVVIIGRKWKQMLSNSCVLKTQTVLPLYISFPATSAK